MTKLVSQHNITIVKDNIVVGALPNANANDVLIYNRKQTDRKLKEIDKSNKAEMLEITKAIAQWGYALGITVVAQDLITLNDFIRENFPNINIFDLKVCVKLVSIDSELLETDAEHYGKLSLIYVSKVLKAYENYKNSVCFGVKEKINKLEEKNKPKISKEERIANFREILTDAKTTVSKGFVFDDYGEVVYNFIRHNKLIVIDNDLIAKAMKSGEEEYRSYISNIKRENLKEMIKNACFTEDEKDKMIKRYARRFVAQFWIEKMNLETMLKKLTYEMLLY